jgi:hypothetical protein
MKNAKHGISIGAKILNDIRLREKQEKRKCVHMGSGDALRKGKW